MKGEQSVLYFIAPIVIGLIVTLILSIVFKDSSKVDRGVELNYFRLSYRRKLIRTLMNIPVIILFLIVIYSFSDWGMLVNTLIVLLFYLIFLIHLYYNIFMYITYLTYYLNYMTRCFYILYAAYVLDAYEHVS